MQELKRRIQHVIAQQILHFLRRIMVRVKLQFLGARVIQGMQVPVELVHRVLRVDQENTRVLHSQVELQLGMEAQCVQHAQPVLQIKLVWNAAVPILVGA